MGITKVARAKAIRYAAWSIACERVALKANPPEKDAHKHMGRGLMPQYELRSLAEKSKHKYTEHLMWELAAKDSIAGPDLYSTLWYTIAGIMESTASARRLDKAAAVVNPNAVQATQATHFLHREVAEGAAPQQHHATERPTQATKDNVAISAKDNAAQATQAVVFPHSGVVEEAIPQQRHAIGNATQTTTDKVLSQSIKNMIRHSSFFNYLREAGEGGLLQSSLKAVGLQCDRWLWILDCPFFDDYDTVKNWADEARRTARACSSIAREKAANDFLLMIETSLSEGDGWLHRFAKNEQQIPATIVIEAVPATVDTLAKPRRYISEPNEILKHHVMICCGHWKKDDQKLCKETIRAIRENMLLIENDPMHNKVYTPDAIRRAAKHFKRGASTGGDNWMLAEMTLMPDIVLTSLGELLADI